MPDNTLLSGEIFEDAKHIAIHVVSELLENLEEMLPHY